MEVQEALPKPSEVARQTLKWFDPFEFFIRFQSISYILAHTSKGPLLGCVYVGPSNKSTNPSYGTMGLSCRGKMGGVLIACLMLNDGPWRLFLICGIAGFLFLVSMLANFNVLGL